MATLVRHSTIRPQLATLAARDCGVVSPSPEAASENPAAREKRDGLWLEYERRLRDPDTYALKDIFDWLKGLGVETSPSSVHRDRTAVLEPERLQRESASETKAILDSLSKNTDTDLFRANRLLLGRAFLDALVSLKTGALTLDKTEDILTMARAVARLSTADAQADLAREKLKALREELAEAVKDKAKTGDGKLSPEDITEISEVVFGRRD
jgi:hypothetical protein